MQIILSKLAITLSFWCNTSFNTQSKNVYIRLMDNSKFTLEMCVSACSLMYPHVLPVGSKARFYLFTINLSVFSPLIYNTPQSYFLGILMKCTTCFGQNFRKQGVPFWYQYCSFVFPSVEQRLRHHIKLYNKQIVLLGLKYHFYILTAPTIGEIGVIPKFLS